MTHRYTLLVGGTILPGGGASEATALAWAEDTVLALGSDAAISGISRGDSHVVDLAGRYVVPLDEGTQARWPVHATLEVGGRADLAILDRDPRQPGAGVRPLAAVAIVRGGRVVAGRLPGAGPPGPEHDHGH